MCKKDGRKLQEDWFKDPSFKEWLKKLVVQESIDLSQNLSLSTDGQASLTGHNNGEKHKDALDKRQKFF